MDNKLLNELGKVDRVFLEEFIFKHLGAERDEVIVKPGHGLDNSIIQAGENKVLIATSDPLSIIPSVGMKISGWLSVHLLASDFTTSGVGPQFALLDFNLPPNLSLMDFSEYFEAIHEECRQIGISIVGGHTGKYPGCDFTIVGGGVLLGFAEERSYVTPAMARDGDAVVITKGPAIATTAILSNAFKNKVRESIGDYLFKKASSYLSLCSTVKDALTASSIGLRDKVSSLHDATEGGVLGGLYELACASSKGIIVDIGNLPIPEEVSAICRLFDLEPLDSLSEGTLIITCSKNSLDELQERLSKSGINSFAIGEIRNDVEGLWVKSKEGKKRYVPPKRDPYWEAYSRAVEGGWN